MGKYVPSTGQVPTGSTDRRVARPHDDAETEGLQCSPKLKVMGRRGWAGIMSGQMGPPGSWDGSTAHTCHQITPNVLLLLSKAPASGARDLKGAAWEPSVLGRGWGGQLPSAS